MRLAFTQSVVSSGCALPMATHSLPPRGIAPSCIQAIGSGTRQRFHGSRIIDDKGNALPNYQAPETFRAYEEVAQNSHRYLMENYPEPAKGTCTPPQHSGSILVAAIWCVYWTVDATNYGPKPKVNQAPIQIYAN
jgi:hypothetical protein